MPSLSSSWWKFIVASKCISYIELYLVQFPPHLHVACSSSSVFYNLITPLGQCMRWSASWRLSRLAQNLPVPCQRILSPCPVLNVILAQYHPELRISTKLLHEHIFAHASVNILSYVNETCTSLTLTWTSVSLLGLALPGHYPPLTKVILA